MTRPPQQDTPTLAYYVGWIVMICFSFSIAWFWPPLVFVGGALALHKSPRRGAFLRFLVHRIGRWLKLDSRRSQILLLGTGLLVLMPLSAASGIKAHQAEVRRIEAERQAVLYEQRRQQQLEEARRQAEAKAAAAQAEAERLKRLRQQQAEADQQAKQKKAAADWAARQVKYEQERREQAAVDERNRQAREQAEEQQAVAEEQQRRAEEGPYTDDDAENMCKDRVAQEFGVERSAVIQQGGFVERMENQPKSMEFGDGHLWVWRPIFKIAGTDVPFNVLCRVFEDGRVEVVDP